MASLKAKPAFKRVARKGRPSKLTDEAQARIIEAVKAGNYLEVAAAYAGIHRDTIFHWLKVGTDTDGPRTEFSRRCAEFARAVESAMALSEVRDVALIARAAAQGDWKAAAWRLERKHTARWGRKDETTIKGDPSAPVETGLTVRVLPANVVDAEGRVIKHLPAPKAAPAALPEPEAE